MFEWGNYMEILLAMLIIGDMHNYWIKRYIKLNLFPMEGAGCTKRFM